MNQHDFETAVMRMWTTTRIPLSRVNVQVYTSAPRDRIERWMNELAKAGLVELDSDDDGEVLWTVRGAKRSATGPRSIDELDRLGRLTREVDAESSPERLRAPVRLASRIADEPTVHDEKSLLASGALSFVFGPVGWLYAAPLKDAVPAIVGLSIAASVMTALLPYTLVASIFGVVSPLSAVAGVIYAYRYNKTGRRASLLELVAERRERLPPGR